MATHNFDRCMRLMLAHEGGYVDHPRDPGGATNLGVTIGTLSEWLGRKATKDEVRALTRERVMVIYRALYWNKINGDALFPGVDYAAFDAAVNAGVGRARQWLSRAVGSADHAVTVKRLCSERLAFKRRLPTWGTFGKGWLRRVTEVEAVGVAMARAAMTQPPATRLEVEDLAKADARIAENKAKTSAGGAVVTGGASAGTAAGGAATLDPTTFDWTAWLFVGGVVLLALTLLAFFIHRWRVEKERARAYEAVALGEIG